MLGFGSGGSGSKTTWVFLAAIVLIALALFFGRDTDFSRIPSLLQSTPKPAADTPPAPGSAGGSRTTVENIPVLPQPSGAPASPGSPNAAVPGQSAPAPGSGPGPAAAPPAGSGGLLRLIFEREAWVEVKQTDGRVLLYGQQKAGSEAQVPLAAEVSLTIGNSDYVRLERDGKPVDLKANSRQGVARLKLTP